MAKMVSAGVQLAEASTHRPSTDQKNTMLCVSLICNALHQFLLEATKVLNGLLNYFGHPAEPPEAGPVISYMGKLAGRCWAAKRGLLQDEGRTPGPFQGEFSRATSLDIS